ncbi:hypothetical protein LOD99_6661 [Oopsacas minuta]|uniref:Glucose-methanol-choline oxidoreductase C-terminal domain-containing protein n=1 Tax=Oopsacas minuta TaxID=111878 RepID=A0AAV7JLR0_9METZ|nr:hypothetical protein LOD99_6661 [Oopsacas minuta]
MAQGEVPQFGYPVPGPQDIRPDDIMNDIFFLNDKEWDVERRKGNFDYVIIGSSFCALAFVDQALKNNPNAKIMIIERGTYYHPEHFQNLPPPFVMPMNGIGETFPWRISKETHEGQYIKWQYGMSNFFGGRSTFWSGWCPEPTDEEMEEWPKETKKVVHKYFPVVKQLLNVIPADQISKTEQGKDTIYGALQSDIQESLKDISSKISTITRWMPAPLAVEAHMYRNINFKKFSVPGPLLSKLYSLSVGQEKASIKDSTMKIVINCVVKMIHHKEGKAVVLETSKGDFVLGNAKVILAMGALPPTTLMLNSFSKHDFPSMINIGERFTAHFISSIFARVPANTFCNYRKFGNMEMSANYIAGRDLSSTSQFHIQLSTIYDNTPTENLFDFTRHLPDVATAPTMKQLLTSTDHVIFVCTVLGELDYDNDQNWFRKNEDDDVTTNVTLQVVANSKDNKVWETMEESSFQMLDILAPSGLEYWHSHGGSAGDWAKGRPTADMIRVPCIVHEASTMRLGKDTGSPVDLDYRFKGVDNVYLTGASLWPTGGSWNPTGTISAIAMHLADLICPKVN